MHLQVVLVEYGLDQSHLILNVKPASKCKESALESGFFFFLVELADGLRLQSFLLESIGYYILSETFAECIVV